MQLHFTGKNIDVTEALKSFTAEKMQAIEKRFPSITIVNIIFNIEDKSQIAEGTLHFDGQNIHAYAEDKDMYHAIGMLTDKLLAQLTKHKERTIDSHR